MSPALGRVRVTAAGLIGTLVVLLVAATCARLGFWQLDRLAQREARNALLEARMAQPPVDPASVARDSTAAYRRITLAGGCEGAQFILAARSRRGVPGVHLLCRFHTAAGEEFLLDRGWLPSADARTLPAEVWRRAPRDTTLEALLVPFPPGGSSETRTRTAARLAEDSAGVRLAEPGPRVLYRLNHAQAEAVTAMELPPWYAQATGASPGPPYPADPPDLSSGPHLGYAVQWFSFALIALIGWAVLARNRGEVAVVPR